MSLIPIPDINTDLITDFFPTEKGKGLFEMVSSGTAFQNPLTGLMDSTRSFIQNDLFEQFDRWINLQDPLPSGFLATDFTEIKEAIEDNFFSALDSFTAHTNLISGVTNTTSSDVPNLRSLITVGSSSVALDNALNRAVGNPCGSLLTAFGSLFLGSEPLNEALGYYQSLIGFINNAEATKMEILGKIEEYKNAIETLIENDVAYFQGLVSDLLFAATSQLLPSFFNSPCGNFLLEKAIGKTDLISFLKN